MSQKPEDMRRFRNHRLELLLLGMALAKEGDRETILETVNATQIQSPLIRQCFQSLKKLEPVDVTIITNIFANWGVPVGGKLTESIVAAINVNNSRRLVAEAVALVTTDNEEEVQKAIDELMDCLAELKKASKGGNREETAAKA